MKGNLSTAVYKTKLEKLRKAYAEKIDVGGRRRDDAGGLQWGQGDAGFGPVRRERSRTSESDCRQQGRHDGRRQGRQVRGQCSRGSDDAVPCPFRQVDLFVHLRRLEDHAEPEGRQGLFQPEERRPHQVCRV